jgi:hypothetical protein
VVGIVGMVTTGPFVWMFTFVSFEAPFIALSCLDSLVPKSSDSSSMLLTRYTGPHGVSESK